MATPKAALEGIRVLDLGRYQAGPRAALILARLGAEVIKIEAPGGDESRAGGPFVRGQSAYWAQYNSGKKSITLDLRQEKGKDVLKDLVKVSDILVQNFRPGTIAEMGFSYEVLQGLNPGIIMLNVSAFGQDGPYRERVGFDSVGQAIGGLMSLTGYEGNPPTLTDAPIIDRITALHGTIGVLAALREREISGQGQAIDVCLADSGFSLTEIPLCHYLGTGVAPHRRGTRSVGSFGSPRQTKDGWALLVAPSQPIWARVCKCLGKPEWTKDPRFVDRSAREVHGGIVEEELVRWFASRTTDEAVETLSAAGIPSAPVNDIAQAARSPQLRARDLLMEMPDPLAGTIHVSGNYIRLSRSQTVVGSTPAIGQHTEEVLCGLLHYPAEKVQRLREGQVI